MCVGALSLGQSAIMSTVGAAILCVTTFALSPFATLTRRVASAAAAVGSADVVDEAARSTLIPKRDWTFEVSNVSRIDPKSIAESAVAVVSTTIPVIDAKSVVRRFMSAFPPGTIGRRPATD